MCIAHCRITICCGKSTGICRRWCASAKRCRAGRGRPPRQDLWLSQTNSIRARPNLPESPALGGGALAHAGNELPRPQLKPATLATLVLVATVTSRCLASVWISDGTPMSSPQSTNCPIRHRLQHPMIRAGRPLPRNSCFKSVESTALRIGLVASRLPRCGRRPRMGNSYFAPRRPAQTCTVSGATAPRFPYRPGSY